MTSGNDACKIYAFIICNVCLFVRILAGLILIYYILHRLVSRPILIRYLRVEKFQKKSLAKVYLQSSKHMRNSTLLL